MVVEVSNSFKPGRRLESNTVLVRLDSREHEIRLAMARAEMNRSESKLTRHKTKLAELSLERATIKMPFEGFVDFVDVSKGQFLKEGVVIGHIHPVRQLGVETEISTFDLQTLSPVVGNTATVGLGGLKLNAVVVGHSGSVDPQTQLVRLFLQITNPELVMFPFLVGSFVEVFIESREKEKVMLLPNDAVRSDGVVWLVSNKQLTSFRTTTFGYSEDGHLVRVFDYFDGVVLGSVPGAREGLSVVSSTP